jgi:hypothetical protein
MIRLGARAISSAPLLELSHPHPHPLAARVSGVWVAAGGQAVDPAEWLHWTAEGDPTMVRHRPIRSGGAAPEGI